MCHSFGIFPQQTEASSEPGGWSHRVCDAGHVLLWLSAAVAAWRTWKWRRLPGPMPGLMKFHTKVMNGRQAHSASHRVVSLNLTQWAGTGGKRFLL